MGRTACTEPQCLYKGDLYLTNYWKHNKDTSTEKVTEDTWSSETGRWKNWACFVSGSCQFLRLYSSGDRWMSMEQLWNDTHGKTRILEHKPVPEPFFPPQISDRLIRDGTRGSVVTGRQLTPLFWTIIIYGLARVHKFQWSVGPSVARKSNNHEPLYGQDNGETAWWCEPFSGTRRKLVAKERRE
jgi:hypothetical protein